MIIYNRHISQPIIQPEFSHLTPYLVNQYQCKPLELMALIRLLPDQRLSQATLTSSSGNTQTIS